MVGLAGHVDHGKTALVQALTGINCDRLPEERERGMTTDLGFAHRKIGEVDLAFIDVPGHERYQPNAVCGLFGCSAVALVVAADEGMCAQTVEHMEICRLLHCAPVIPVITKIDRVESGFWAERAEAIHRHLRQAIPHVQPPALVSAKTGHGMDALVARLVAEASRKPPLDGGGVRLPIDRAFSLRGAGVVVAGTLRSGTLKSGAEVRLMPGDYPVRVKSLERYGRECAAARAPTRVSVLLGGVGRDQLERGHELTSAGVAYVSRAVLVELRFANGQLFAKRRYPVRCFINAAQVMGIARPVDRDGDRMVASVMLVAPITATRGDRVLLCEQASRRVIGGGRIVDPHWTTRPKGARTRLKGWLGGLDDAVYGWIDEAAESGMSTRELARLSNATVVELDNVLSKMQTSGHVECLDRAAGDDVWISDRTRKRVQCEATEVLEKHSRSSVTPWLSKAALTSALARRSSERAPAWVAMLVGSGVLHSRGPLIAVADAARAFQETEDRVRSAIDALSSVVRPIGAGEVSAAAGLDIVTIRAVGANLSSIGDLHATAEGSFVSAAALDRLVRTCVSSELSEFRVCDFTAAMKMTRKHAIPLLELLDSVGVTRRIGDRRLLLVSPNKNSEAPGDWCR